MPTDPWPSLVWTEWKDTSTTLNLWLQIVGKVRLARTPWINHSWQVVLYPTARGLTTGPIPHGQRVFDIDVDLLAHHLSVNTSDGARARVELRPRSVADFYHAFMDVLDGLGLSTDIHPAPNEIPDAIPFVDDEVHGSYDADAVERFARVVNSATRVLTDFRSRFVGKCSPVHYFWGGHDLAVTRFSGREAPPHPGGIPNLPDWVGREAYSHEVSSAGFWPGADHAPEAVVYAYAYPTPDGYRNAEVRPEAATWSDELGEFLLPYEAMRASDDPDAALMAFLESTYEAAADLAGWDRDALEWAEGEQPPPGGW